MLKVIAEFLVLKWVLGIFGVALLGAIIYAVVRNFAGSSDVPG